MCRPRAFSRTRKGSCLFGLANDALGLSSGTLDDSLDMHYRQKSIGNSALELGFVSFLLGLDQFFLGESVVSREHCLASVVADNKLAHGSSRENTLGFKFFNVNVVFLFVFPIKRDGWSVAYSRIVSHGLGVASDLDRVKADALFAAGRSFTLENGAGSGRHDGPVCSFGREFVSAQVKIEDAASGVGIDSVSASENVVFLLQILHDELAIINIVDRCSQHGFSGDDHNSHVDCIIRCFEL